MPLLTHRYNGLINACCAENTVFKNYHLGPQGGLWILGRHYYESIQIALPKIEYWEPQGGPLNPRVLLLCTNTYCFAKNYHRGPQGGLRGASGSLGDIIMKQYRLFCQTLPMGGLMR